MTALRAMAGSERYGDGLGPEGLLGAGAPLLRPRQAPRLRIVRPEGAVPVAKGDELSDYQVIARDLGFSPKGIDEHKLRALMQTENLREYAYPAVAAYMDELVAKEGATWYWRPLRSLDASTYLRIRGHEKRTMRNYDSDDRRNGFYDADDPRCSVYDRAIPITILRDAAKVAKAFPSARLLVTDYSVEREPVRNPDPFIAATFGGELIVFGVWDEPGFGG